MARRGKKTSKLTKEQLRKIEAAVRRELAKEAGYYDGRNAPRVYEDRRKQASKDACRKKDRISVRDRGSESSE